MFLIRVQVFWELPHVQIFMNDEPNPLTWNAQFLSYWFSRNPAAFQDKLMNLMIISGVVTVLGCPGWGASQVEKSPCLSWAIQFLMVAYDGARSPNVSVRMAWISLGALPCRKKKTWWQLTSHCWNRASPDMLPFSLCNKKGLAIRHTNRPLFPAILSIPSYDIGK